MMLDRLVATEREYAMEINAEKAKIMQVSRDEKPWRTIVNNRELENLSEFRYSECLLNRNAYCSKEIREETVSGEGCFQ